MARPMRAGLRPALFLYDDAFPWKDKDAAPEKQLFPQRFTRFSIRFFIRKKTFTPSHGGFLCMIFRGFECEGFDFKVFTSAVAFLSFICWFSGGFPVWRLTLSTFHKRSPPVWMLCCPCEHFKINAFTLETIENQQTTSIVWMGEYFFRQINYVYTRA